MPPACAGNDADGGPTKYLEQLRRNRAGFSGCRKVGARTTSPASTRQRGRCRSRKEWRGCRKDPS